MAQAYVGLHLLQKVPEMPSDEPGGMRPRGDPPDPRRLQQRAREELCGWVAGFAGARAEERAVRSPLPLQGAAECRVVADRRLQERLIWLFSLALARPPARDIVFQPRRAGSGPKRSHQPPRPVCARGLRSARSLPAVAASRPAATTLRVCAGAGTGAQPQGRAPGAGEPPQPCPLTRLGAPRLIHPPSAPREIPHAGPHPPLRTSDLFGQSGSQTETGTMKPQSPALCVPGGPEGQTAMLQEALGPPPQGAWCGLQGQNASQRSSPGDSVKRGVGLMGNSRFQSPWALPHPCSWGARGT
ncbi:transcription initiation factor TFIID subunit 4-like [Lemur catta]|uniref:transcription initiation factor TFIID subunit 4-like n=1 Tax=Lemur catta TaxID=9447 RepID=UPI001E266822|nr:transcription initiation factor TFIID subunit 4-like [Lemur catta]